MELKNGLYLVNDKGDGSRRAIKGRVSAQSLLSGNPFAEVIGYVPSRTARGISYYFRDVYGSHTGFRDIDEAEDYIHMRGWDDDDDSRLGSYSVIPGRVTIGRTARTANNTISGSSKSLSDWATEEREKDSWTIGYAEKPKCDCGGEKCKLPHMTWCSVYKEPE